MCFSATASFVAAGILGAAWLLILSRITRRDEFLLSFVPLLFALQQAAEGIIWVVGEGRIVKVIAAFFLIVATVFWPTYAPAMVLMMEKDKRRRKLLKKFLIAGIGLSFVLGFLLVPHPSNPAVSDSGIQYRGSSVFSNQPIIEYAILAWYLLVVVGSCLVSSTRIIRIFGILLGVSLVAALVLSTTTYGSRWCYFAALLTLVLVVYFLNKRRRHN